MKYADIMKVSYIILKHGKISCIKDFIESVD